MLTAKCEVKFVTKNLLFCSLRIFYDRGECVVVNTSNSDVDEIQEMISRLSVVTHGCEVLKLDTSSNSYVTVNILTLNSLSGNGILQGSYKKILLLQS